MAQVVAQAHRSAVVLGLAVAQAWVPEAQVEARNPSRVLVDWGLAVDSAQVVALPVVEASPVVDSLAEAVGQQCRKSKMPKEM